MKIQEWLRKIDNEGNDSYLIEVVGEGIKRTIKNHHPYHNEDHLIMCFGAIRECWYTDRIPLSYAMAIAWHDAVYIPDAPDGYNEELSAVAFQACENYNRFRSIAAGFIQSKDAPPLVQQVKIAIKHTSIKHHLAYQLTHCVFPEVTNQFCERICDADLSAMGNPHYEGFFLTQAKLLAETYDTYYAVVLGDSEKYISNVTKFFESLTNRQFVFRTFEARSAYETNAKRNIKKFIHDLTTDTSETCRQLVALGRNEL